MDHENIGPAMTQSGLEGRIAKLEEMLEKQKVINKEIMGAIEFVADKQHEINCKLLEAISNNENAIEELRRK